MNYETNYSEISTNQGKSNPFAAIDRDTDLATLLRSGMFVQTRGGKYGVVAGDKSIPGRHIYRAQVPRRPAVCTKP